MKVAVNIRKLFGVFKLIIERIESLSAKSTAEAENGGKVREL
ncbi:hypothetical protein GLGR_2959 [Leminorella grimontii ATCC 33999 = DSM 5078]|nr:hypothetical protein GLGR_2959 [Leminorella grimontii ATCC 33999 = DSM 5078]